MPRRNHQQKHVKFTPSYNCSTKNRYPNEYKAKEAADYQMLIKPDLDLSVYLCDFCGGWHLTRKKAN